MATTTAPPKLTEPSTQQSPTIFLPYEPLTTVPVTYHAFPSLEPRGVDTYPTQHLYLPMRRDILHLAVTYEGDNTRQGTASSKTRWEVHGSHRKMRPQKGSGRARVGTRQSPLQSGGGKSFGPRPRDFGTGLTPKVYDIAWRTALSYRFRRGELVVVEDGLDVPLPQDFLALAAEGKLGRELEDGFLMRYMNNMMESMRWGAKQGRTTFITTEYRPNLFTSMEVAQQHGRAIRLDNKENPLDVKNLLETARIVVERSALRAILLAHQRDMVKKLEAPADSLFSPGKRRRT